MIILTQPNIYRFKPIKISSTVVWANHEYCLAEVEDSFNLSYDELDENDIDFWWECGSGWFAWEDFEKTRKIFKTFDGGLPEAIANAYNISKENNIACAIGTVCANIYQDPFKLWEKMITKK